VSSPCKKNACSLRRLKDESSSARPAVKGSFRKKFSWKWLDKHYDSDLFFYYENNGKENFGAHNGERGALFVKP
jgi:hypothetical protein